MADWQTPGTSFGVKSQSLGCQYSMPEAWHYGFRGDSFANGCTMVQPYEWIG